MGRDPKMIFQKGEVHTISNRNDPTPVRISIVRQDGQYAPPHNRSYMSSQAFAARRS